MRLPLLLAVVLVAGCDGAPARSGNLGLASGEPVLPDTQTIDGVLVMRHGADAFARAPVWTLDTVPQVVIDGGEEFDLSGVPAPPIQLSGGRWVTLKAISGVELVLFDSTGHPIRLIAGMGSGPGELMRPQLVASPGGDTLAVVDDANRTRNLYHPDHGLVSSDRFDGTVALFCFRPGGWLPDGRAVAIGGCSSNRRSADGELSTDTPLVLIAADMSSTDTVAMVPGAQMRMAEARSGSHRMMVPMWVRLGRATSVTTVDSAIVVASGVGGYVLELRDGTGRVTGRIEVDRPAVMVTDAMREAVIALELERLSTYSEGGQMNPDAERMTREGPIADTLPAYQAVFPGEGGLFWVMDHVLPGDTTWAATAFRADGAIVARIRGSLTPGPYGAGPVAFLRDRVIMREADGDGVVRFGVYGVIGVGHR